MRLSIALIVTTLIVALTLAIALLTVHAQDTPVIPDEATKIRALKRGYEINGNSMVGKAGETIDLSKEDLSTDPAVQAHLPPPDPLPKKGRKP